MGKISYKVSKPERALLMQIAKRAIGSIQELTARQVTLLDMLLILTACHANGCPLRLRGLLQANEVDFARDVVGIYKHLATNTGTLIDFEPRYRLHQRAA